MNLRIQTYGKYLFLLQAPILDKYHRRLPANRIAPLKTEDTTAVEALEKGLDDLMDLCDVVTEKFTVARDEFNVSQENRMTT